MNVVFIADLFKENLIGGAELNDSVLINYLSNNGFNVIKAHSTAVTEEMILENDLFLISNFTQLSERLKQMIMLKKYIIYEHDHKYIKTRNPSNYPNFLAPKTQIINRDFYAKAHKVVVLSKICKEVIEKNLQINNVISIGCSLWSKEKLDYIESITDTEKIDKYCVLNSSNSIKGTKEAIQLCELKDLDYELVGNLPEKEMLLELSKYKYFVFLPQVLETLSRITVEAKMLNCKVLTKSQMLGAASEDWFKLSGKELISTIRQKVDAALNTFVEILNEEKDITVILNCYRRPEYLQKQIDSLKSQTIKPKQIWIWVNHHEDNESVDFSQYDVDRVIKNDFNWKFYGRFAGAMLAETKYIALFDDDTIPGTKWFENCLNTIEQTPGILGGAGVLLKEDKYYGHERTGWSAQNSTTAEVDLVGHAWFFEKDWLKYLWMEKPFTWENGEDIQFSYTAQKYGNIKTYCPPHPPEEKELHSSLMGYELGVDAKATSNSRNHEVFYAQRDACVKNAIINGWQPVYKRNK